MNYLLSQLKVKKVMTQNPITISPFATISEAAWTMLEYKVSGLPVVDQDRKLLGIITESDIFRLVVQEWDRMENAVNAAVP
jgi:acetoin utilization protein AcuB